MNKTLFPSQPSNKRIPTTNAAGGTAYKTDAKHALAKTILVGTLADNAYTPGSAQLREVLELCAANTPEFVAKAALYAKEHGKLKDMPTLLLCYLGANGHNKLASSIAPRIMPTAKDMRNYVQIYRSGVVNRKGLGTSARNIVRRWFADRNIDELYKGSHGTSPSMLDCLRLTKPKPTSESHNQFYGWLAGKREAPEGSLAARVKAWAADDSKPYPAGAPFELVAAHCKTPLQWEQLAMSASWNATIKNLNTFARHGVFKQHGATAVIEHRLKATPPKHVMPWSVYASYIYTQDNNDIPMSIKLAVQDALDSVLRNTPEIPGNSCVLIDTSGSMTSAITGNRGSATSKISCSQASMLIAAAFLKRNPNTKIVTFDTSARLIQVNPRDSVATMTRGIPFTGGGTDLACGLRGVAQLDNIQNLLVVSDNQSWMSGSSEAAWSMVQQKHPGIRMACLDIAPETSVKLPEGRRVMHMAGAFSDYYWPFLKTFFAGELAGERVVQAIENQTI